MANTILTILVLAVGGNVSQGILKALARSSINCRVIGTDLDALQMGLYTVDRGYVAPHATDPHFIDWLIHLCREEHVDAILSGCEPVLRVLTQERSRIEAETLSLCFVCSPRVWHICDDKLLTCKWLKENGFAYPAYADPSDPIAVSELLEKTGFPLIAKPRIGGGAHGIILVENKEDLDYVKHKTNYVLQEVLGENSDEYTVGCFCDKDFVVRGSIVMWRELLAGTTYRAVVGLYEEVKQAAEQIATALEVQGPCNIQMRMTQSGPVCFEINPRFSGTTPIRAALGFNEVEAAIRHFLLGGQEVTLPVVTQGIALRYWNELYVHPEEYQQLNEHGVIDPQIKGSHRIERYGSQ